MFPNFLTSPAALRPSVLIRWIIIAFISTLTVRWWSNDSHHKKCDEEEGGCPSTFLIIKLIGISRSCVLFVELPAQFLQQQTQDFRYFYFIPFILAKIKFRTIILAYGSHN